MILGGASFCVGAILCAFAQDLAMLIIGRVCLGAGVGFANQVQFCCELAFRELLVTTSAACLHRIQCLSAMQRLFLTA